ncbi:FadR/GntR family transcriptional regulator [Piscinibacter sp.]|jgi:DNA-binding FadR family transcriptional regulator|uniref:FadR/GntR family transcriptional regulator n=1 Tax=Piscinibacter sp. TaxID=1903157 RepID=UPI00355A3006
MELVDRLPGGEREIAKRPVKNQISDKLAYMIHSGLLRPGDELPSERRLAETLGVSRETVRSAIATLQAHRMIDVSQGSRTRVIGPGNTPLNESVATFERLKGRSPVEVAEARAVVEAQVVRLAAVRISKSALARMEALLAEQQGMLKDPVSFQISDREFHTVLYEACGNALLCEVVSDLYAYALDLRRQALQRRGAIARSVEDHHAILAALARRDPDAAAAAMGHHLDQVHSTTLKEMKK